MQTAINYLSETPALVDRAMVRMQPMLPAVPAQPPLPTSREAMTLYIEQLLTSDEQRVCDMATD